MFLRPYFRLHQVLTEAEVLNFMLSKLPPERRKAETCVRPVLGQGRDYMEGS